MDRRVSQAAAIRGNDPVPYHHTETMTAIIAGIAGGAVIMILIVLTVRWALDSFGDTDDAAKLIEKWRKGE